jgi:hypothetical protein
MWTETTVIHHEDLPECRMLAAEIRGHAQTVSTLMEQADKAAAAQGVWNWVQRMTISDLEDRLWR